MLEKECIAALAIVRPHLSVIAPTLLEQTATKVGNAVSQNKLTFYLKGHAKEFTYDAF